MAGLSLIMSTDRMCRWTCEDLPCTSMDPEVFFPETREGEKDARQICAGCPARQDCLEQDILEHIQRMSLTPCGIRAGLDAKEREYLVARARHLYRQQKIKREAEDLELPGV